MDFEGDFVREKDGGKNERIRKIFTLSIQRGGYPGSLKKEHIFQGW
jgi:hypothetical protein